MKKIPTSRYMENQNKKHFIKLNNMNDNYNTNNNNNYKIKNDNNIKENYPKLDIIESDNDNENYKYLKIDQEIFIIKFIKGDNQISISCIPLDEFVCLYDYSIQISYEEFCRLSKTFSVYESIDDIFKIIKNIVEEVNLTTNEEKLVESNIYIQYSTNESIILNLKIPLLIGTYEKIKIEFNKVEKNINEQFKKLKKNYLNLKTVILTDKIDSTRKKLIYEIKNPKKIIQNKF